MMMLPLSLYIHTPWCTRKCPYCDFNSHKSPTTLPEEAYLTALLADLKQDLLFANEQVAFEPQRLLTSIFIGGGTPSLFSGQFYHRLLENLRQIFCFSPNIEITLEANPGSVEQQRFKDYRQAGINRLSLGIQSFNPKHLQQLGRVHTAHQAHQAIETARNAGFTNINLDLMNSLPEQTVEEGINDLTTALNYQPEHLSWYQLTLEPNTVFYTKPPKLPTEDICMDIEEEGFRQLADHGYLRYEISAFAKPQHHSQHNLNYWLFGDYLGIGAGAHGKMSNLQSQAVIRTCKYRQPNDYLHLEKPFRCSEERIEGFQLMFEFMLNTTRLQQAIPFSLFNERTGLAFSSLEPKLEEAKAKGFLELSSTHWQVTELGRRFTNDLQCLFLIDNHE